MPAMPEKPIQPLITKFRKLKAEIKAKTLEIHDKENPGEGVEDQILSMMRTRKLDTVTVKIGQTNVTATPVYASQEVVDAVKLKKRVGTVKWKKIVSEVLDNKKLQDAMASGLIDPNIVASCSESAPKKPYLKLTEKGVK
jgi:hypothetical protein